MTLQGVSASWVPLIKGNFGISFCLRLTQKRKLHQLSCFPLLVLSSCSIISMILVLLSCPSTDTDRHTDNSLIIHWTHLLNSLSLDSLCYNCLLEGLLSGNLIKRKDVGYKPFLGNQIKLTATTFTSRSPFSEPCILLTWRVMWFKRRTLERKTKDIPSKGNFLLERKAIQYDSPKIIISDTITVLSK